jgi:hypothetical protein
MAFAIRQNHLRRACMAGLRTAHVMASTNKALAATADQDAGPATRAHHQMGKAARRSHLPWHRGRGSVRRREFSELSWRYLPMR